MQQSWIEVNQNLWSDTCISFLQDLKIYSIEYPALHILCCHYLQTEIDRFVITTYHSRYSTTSFRSILEKCDDIEILGKSRYMPAVPLKLQDLPHEINDNLTIESSSIASSDTSYDSNNTNTMAISSIINNTTSSNSIVERMERLLLNLVTTIYPNTKNNNNNINSTNYNTSSNNNETSIPFPLNRIQFSKTRFGARMIQSLEDSFHCYNTLSTYSVQIDDLFWSVVQTIRVTCIGMYDKMENIIKQQLDNLVTDTNAFSKQFYLDRLANHHPVFSRYDLLSIAIKPDLLLNFNPFLSANQRNKIYSQILLCLKLLVLSERINRIIQHANSSNESSVIDELLTYRMWSVEDYPEWLVFEVENNLQIRPCQYELAHYLIDHPGAISQLNMGEGKTRVIIPMLLLYFRYDHTIRLNFLTPLLDDAYSFLHQTLTASVLNVRFFKFPVKSIKEIYYRYLNGQNVHGIIVVAPEHRLSLLLKRIEYHLNKEETLANAIIDSMKAIKFADIFDESDEQLRHNYQLIYAIGDHLNLPSGPSRWIVAQALLRLIDENKIIRDLLLNHSEIATQELIGSTNQRYIRLLPGEALDSMKPKLYQALVTALMENPPYELQWLKTTIHKANILKYVIQPDDVNDDVLNMVANEFPNFDSSDHTLALRGFLAGGIFEHCLCKRPRVDYGIKRPNKKRLVVPFRSSDVPADRAEYAHPDIAIMLTNLSYLMDGLSCDEFYEALRKLLSLNITAKNDIFNSWYKLRHTNLSNTNTPPTTIPCEINNVDKIDINNSIQISYLFQQYQFNREAIFFWLNNCVFPIETKQFEHRITATTWNLTDNITGRMNGFSGTDDNKDICPLKVTQHEHSNERLRATNGKMVTLLLSKCQFVDKSAFNTIKQPVDAPRWSRIAELAVSLNTNAIIDVGAIMHGVSNREVGIFVLKQLKLYNRPEANVVFYDNELKSWQVLNQSGREWNLEVSPVREHDCFVFFDESHCRGSDMKLLPHAVALLTIGPGMCKDKLMQALGRMRKLDKGQSILLYAPDDVKNKIFECARNYNVPNPHILSPVLLLNWVMANTIAACQEGLIQWAKQGEQFCLSSQNTEYAKTTEKMTLQEYYQCSFSPKIMSEVFMSQSNLNTVITEPGNSDYKSLATELKNRVESLGSDYTIIASTYAEECERELEQEEEQEEEVEIEIPNMIPYSETDWINSTSIFTVNTITEISSICPGPRMTSMSDFLRRETSSSLNLSCLPWSTNIYVTTNFYETIDDVGKIDNYLRIADGMLVCKDQSVLLLSEREFDQCLALRNSIISSGTNHNSYFNTQLVHFSYCGYLKKENYFRHSKIEGCVLNINTYVLLKVFNGETKFSSSIECAELRKLLRTAKQKLACLQFADLRGLSATIYRSELEIVCRERSNT